MSKKETFEEIRDRLSKKLKQDIEEDKQRLSKMSSERRKVELELREQWKKQDEKNIKEQEKLDKNLNEKEQELRSKIENFIGDCTWKEGLRSFSSEDAIDNYARKSNKEMVPKMEEIVKLANNDINKIKKVITSRHWEDFKRRYSLYSKSGKAVLFIRGRIR